MQEGTQLRGALVDSKDARCKYKQALEEALKRKLRWNVQQGSLVEMEDKHMWLNRVKNKICLAPSFLRKTWLTFFSTPIAWKVPIVGEIFFQIWNLTTFLSTDNFQKRQEPIEKKRTGLASFGRNFSLVHQVLFGIVLAETSDHILCDHTINSDLKFAEYSCF